MNFSKLLGKNMSIVIVTLVLAMPLMSVAPSNTYEVTRLVANAVSYNASYTDARLINPWGLTFNHAGDLIIADNNGPSLATSYEQDGEVRPFSIAGSLNPTGLESNHNDDDFLIGASPNQEPARLLFATELGTIVAFNKGVNTSSAVGVIDRSAVGAVYKGLALGYVGHDAHQSIFAADFHNGNIDVFDHNFNYVTSFTDATVPAGYAPFNVQNFGGWLYVAYAVQDAAKHDDVAGLGNGIVDVFDTSGNLVNRLVSNGALNAPWGLAIAPDNFGRFSGALLVGNFGDGLINAYDPKDGTFLGNLTDDLNNSIAIDGLWSLKFGDYDFHHAKLYFTSGPNGEADGLVGVIEPNRDLNLCHLP
jgi:uncharacterized protein (TIGR03118 family)